MKKELNTVKWNGAITVEVDIKFLVSFKVGDYIRSFNYFITD